MKNELSTVVFDLGGVLIDWNPRHVYLEVFAGDTEKVEWFLADVCSPDWNAKQDAGRSLADATEELVSAFPEYEELIRVYYDRWEEMMRGPIEGTVEILRRMRESPYRLYALTNWSRETFPVARERFEFINWFEGIVVSGEIGLIKPDPAIFHHLTRGFGLNPAETVFIDDVPANVEAARRLGFHAIRFVSPEQLATDLRRAGIHIDESSQP